MSAPSPTGFVVNEYPEAFTPVTWPPDTTVFNLPNISCINSTFTKAFGHPGGLQAHIAELSGGAVKRLLPIPEIFMARA